MRLIELILLIQLARCLKSQAQQLEHEHRFILLELSCLRIHTADPGKFFKMDIT